MSSPGDSDIATDTGTVSGSAAVSAPRPRDRRLRLVPEEQVTPPPAGQPGHGSGAVLRRQPVRIVNGRFEGGYTDVFEIICPSCGDHPYLDFVDVPAQLQRLRGSYVLAAAVAAYEEHLGLSSCSDENSPSGPGPRDAKNGAPTEAANGDSPSDSVSASTTL